MSYEGNALKAPKFKVGDRVVLARCDNRGTLDDAEIGQTGTVIELSEAPWVRFDEPTGYECGNGFGLTGWKTGYMDCLTEEQLDLINE